MRYSERDVIKSPEGMDARVGELFYFGDRIKPLAALLQDYTIEA